MRKTYRINEIFFSLQGEGRNTGQAATFVRFAGCNLRCPFCDTDFARYTELTASDIVSQLAPAPLVVLTGGEPTLQVDTALIEALHAAGKTIAMETNGTHQPPPGIDWLTVSPKGPVVVKRADEVKVVFETEGHQPSDHGIEADHYYLQPCDTGQPERNRAIVKACIDYILSHPRWRLSLQTHKLTGIR